MKTELRTVDDYIAQFPIDIQVLMQKMRETVLWAAPKAVESISYGLAGYKTYGKALVYFGGFKNHIGFYATPQGHEAFAAELSKYKQGKGSVQFQLNEPIPFDLVYRIVQFRDAQNAEKHKTK